MRLRQNTHAPRRYDDEDYGALRPRRGRRPGRPARNQVQPTIVDFNPNLPPAAFPTLDRPYVGETSTSENRRNGSGNENRRASEGMRPGQQGQRRSSSNQNQRRGVGVDKATQVDYADLPMGEIENRVASNGDLNPTYVRNMERMANAVENPFADMEESDIDYGSDPSEVVDPSPVPPTTPVLSDPQWSDLSPRMQVEIFSNLFKTPGSTRGAIGVGFMLGLTQEERSEVGKQIGKRNRQIMQENLELKDMRLKQLTALMRLDNTQLKQHSVPHQLIFRKTSRRYTRRLRERLDMDYLLCQSRELLTARRFLHRRGIDRSFAGDWGNEMVSLKGPDDGAEPEIFEWKEDSTPSPCTTDNTAEAGAQTSSRAPKSNLALREANREAFINDAGDARTMDPREMTQCRGNPFETSRWLDDSQRLLHRIRFEQHQREQAKSREIPQEGVSGILSLKINDGRAAQIHCSDKIYIERQVVIRPSSCSNRNPNSPKADGEYGMIKHPTFPNVKITVPDVPSIRINRFPPQASVGNPDNGNPRPAVCEQPVQRAIGGAWSYNSVTSRAGPQVSSFARVRENLEAAKRDGEQAGASQPQNQSGAGDARSSGQAANPMPTGVAHPMMYAPPPSRHAMLGRDWDADPLQQYVSLPMIDINAEMDTAGVDGDDIFGMLKIKSPGHSSAGRPAGENVP